MYALYFNTNFFPFDDGDHYHSPSVMPFIEFTVLRNFNEAAVSILLIGHCSIDVAAFFFHFFPNSYAYVHSAMNSIDGRKYLEYDC